MPETTTHPSAVDRPTPTGEIDFESFNLRTNTEVEFRALWRHTSGSPFQRAFHAGLLADRLSWVFCAGYQSAVRAMFGERDAHHWIAFAVSEDRHGKLPGTCVVDGKLSGHKTWIAAVNHVDEIILTADCDGSSRCLRVAVPSSNIHLRARDNASFLADMSQGSAHFDHVSIAPQHYFDKVKISDFGLAEPAFILSAGAAYIMCEAHRCGDKVLGADARNIAQRLEQLCLAGFKTDLTKLIEIQNDVVDIGKSAGRLASTHGLDSATDWRDNGRLLGMYRQMLRQRQS